MKSNVLRHKKIGLWILALILLAAAPLAAVEAAGTKGSDRKPLSHALLVGVNRPFKGDLPSLQRKRSIRVLVSFSKTNFFFNLAKPMGFEYELLHSYETYLNRRVKDRTRRIHLIFIPTRFDRLLKDLAAGRGDIAAAGLTITKSREQLASFTSPYLSGIGEVVVTNRKVDKLRSLEDLSGKKVYVRRGSSYITHLTTLNRKLQAAGRNAVRIEPAESHLSTEDILELVNAGVVKITVVDSHIAGLWSQALPNITVYKDLAVNSDGRIAWAVRKTNPKLRASLNAYIRKSKKGTLLGNMLFKRYYRNTDWVKNPLNEKDRRKLQQMTILFKKYGRRYGFDWLAIAAQAYQESGLEQSKKSPAGAIGIMQIKPQTAADKTVNIRHIERLENNIHAGVKYLDYLRHSYFDDAKIAPADRVYFSWAAYNAGPARISQLRRKGARMGVDPDKWFFNVENVAARYIGRETVDYVANINKYYVAYKLSAELQHRKETHMRKKGHAAVSVHAGVADGKSQAAVVPAAGGAGGKASAPQIKQSQPAKKSTRKTAAKRTTVRYHTVRRGETLYGIAGRYKLTVKTLQQLNGMSSETVLNVGTRLRLSR